MNSYMGRGVGIKFTVSGSGRLAHFSNTRRRRFRKLTHRTSSTTTNTKTKNTGNVTAKAIMSDEVERLLGNVVESAGDVTLGEVPIPPAPE